MGFEKARGLHQSKGNSQQKQGKRHPGRVHFEREVVSNTPCCCYHYNRNTMRVSIQRKMIPSTLSITDLGKVSSITSHSHHHQHPCSHSQFNSFSIMFYCFPSNPIGELRIYSVWGQYPLAISSHTCRRKLPRPQLGLGVFPPQSCCTLGCNSTRPKRVIHCKIDRLGLSSQDVGISIS